MATFPTGGGWSIERGLFDHLVSSIPAGGVLVELGSGYVSPWLAQHFTVHSYEESAAWMRKQRPESWVQVHAPLVNGWYDPRVVERTIPKRYDALLVDGPIGGAARLRMLHHLNLFDWSASVVVDDANRPEDMRLVESLARHIARTRPCVPQVVKGQKKWFAVL